MNEIVSQFRLLSQKRFLPFFVTQFFGAFNDNVYKNALIIIIAFKAQDSVLPVNTLTNLSAALFILPFFLFSAIAGQYIDKKEKSSMIRRIKILEIIIMLAAAIGFVLGNIYWLIAMLFLMGTQSTFFGPAKYGYIPQHMSEHELTAANGLVQMGTFVAILTGTMVGGILASIDDAENAIALAIVGFAIAGYVSARSIPYTEAAAPKLKLSYNFAAETWRTIQLVSRERNLFVPILGISWFWFLGATYLVQLPNYTKTALNANEQVVTLLLTLFTLGIGLGSLVCNRLSRSRIEPGLVPLGALGMSIFGVDLVFANPAIVTEQLSNFQQFIQWPGTVRMLFDVLLVGICGGVYIVPLFAMVQSRSEQSHLSRVIAGNNIFNALLMVVSAVLAIVFLGKGHSIAQLFLLVSALNVVVLLFLLLALPEFVHRGKAVLAAAFRRH